MKPTTFKHGIVIAFFAALASGCAPIHLALHQENTAMDGTGIVRQCFVQPYPIEVIVDGQLYTGEWRTQEAPDHPLADSYLHKHHVGRVVTTLISGDGKHLYCNWLVHSFQGSGICEDDSHNKYDVTIG